MSTKKTRQPLRARRTTGQSTDNPTAARNELIAAGKRRGYHVLDATADGAFVGEPRRSAGSVRPQDESGKRYKGADCPFCEGPLVETPQCNGRAVTDAAPHELFLMDPLPATNIAVACLECRFAFYPLVASA